jgi:hypothetical protein
LVTPVLQEIGLWTKEERELADAFVEYWTSFAANGVPGTATLPQWQAFNLVGGEEVPIGTAFRGGFVGVA